MLKHSTVNPFAFTEQGVAMLSTVLKSDIAVKVSIGIMDAFVEMHQLLSSKSTVHQRLSAVEYKQIVTEQRIEELFGYMKDQLPPKQGIFFQGHGKEIVLLFKD